MKRRARGSADSGDPLNAPLEALLDAQRGVSAPSSTRLLAWREGDDPRLLDAIARRAKRIVDVERFGEHLLSVADLGNEPAGAPTSAWRVARRRWRAAQPIVLARAAADLVARDRAASDGLNELERLLSALRRRGTLRRFLRERGFAARSMDREDDRDIEKLSIDGASGLWVKSSTLTSPETNRSGRVRFSFGVEGDDDASDDLRQNQAVSELAQRCVPFARRCARSKRLRHAIDRIAGEPLFPTQQILYWNAPQGGALMHHDAFDEPARSRQRGVCYVQASGSTLWLALSTSALTRHVGQFLRAVARGAAPWTISTYFGGRRAFERLARCTASDLRAELVAPGCGAFARLVNRSPEFLAQLVDAGHATILDPGDVILLPNHGYARTCLHAVWCASPTPGAALSMALRARTNGR